MRLPILVCIATTVSLAASLNAAVMYDVVNLGCLEGGTYSRAWGVNNAGQIVGEADVAGATHAVMWDDGKIIDLGTLSGFANSCAMDINDSGKVVGYAYTAGANPSRQAFQGTTKKLTMLNYFGGADSWATGINEKGDIVGGYQTSNGYAHAYVYRKNAIEDLNHWWDGDGDSTANAISDTGIVVGSNNHGVAYFYANGMMASLGTIGESSELFDVTDAGVAIGIKGGHLVVYGPAGFTDLGPVGDVRDFNIGGDGMMAGWERSGTTSGATGYDGAYMDLNDHTTTGLWHLLMAADTNDDGCIVGTGMVDGQMRAFMLVEGMPEPATVALLLLGAVGVLLRRRP